MALSLNGKNSYLYSITGIVKLENNNHKIAYIYYNEGGILNAGTKSIFNCPDKFLRHINLLKLNIRLITFNKIFNKKIVSQ